MTDAPVLSWYLASELKDGTIQMAGPLVPHELTKNLHVAVKKGEPTAVTRAFTIGSALLSLVSDINEKHKPA